MSELGRGAPGTGAGHKSHGWAGPAAAGMLLACAAAFAGEPPKAQKPPSLWSFAEAKLVNQWWREGTAAGNAGDRYDNRDGGHSPLHVDKFPQIEKIAYARPEIGAQKKVLPHVTVGNSSTVQTTRNMVGPRGISHARNFYVHHDGLSLLHSQYRGNNLYVYPEHRDHGPGRNGRPEHGDVYPTNTPYLIISQGSSGSDQAFLRAMVHTMAAFRPEVKKKLIEEKLLMPTLQAIMRASYKEVRKKEDYLTGKAHPTAFEGSKLDPVKMVTAAHGMTAETIPPLVHLEVLGEDFGTFGGRSEKLSQTPAVIARVHRDMAYRKRIVVSARKSRSLDGKPLKYHWAVLRGDAARIEIKPRDGGAVAELTIPYHDRAPVPGSRVDSNRVDIGVFVESGGGCSAPGFVTVFYLDCEARTYSAAGQLRDVYFAGGDTRIGCPVDASSALVPLPGAKGGYDIFDWPALFAAAAGNSRDLGAGLLRERLNDAERAVVARAAAAFKPGLTAKLKLSGKLSREQRAEQLRIRNELGAALTAVDPGVKASARDVLERALNAIRGDPGLYGKHARQIEPLAAACADQKGKAAFLAARNRVARLGLFRRGTQPQTTTPGARKPTDFTKYEVYAIESLNLAIMNHLLYPLFLRRLGADKANCVEPRLGSPQDRRLTGR